MPLMRLSRMGSGMDSASRTVHCNAQESDSSLVSQLADTLRAGVDTITRKLSSKGPTLKPGNRKLVLSSNLLAPLDHLHGAGSDASVSSGASTSTSSSRSNPASTRTPSAQYAKRLLSKPSFDRRLAQLDAARGMESRKHSFSAFLPKRQLSLRLLMHQREPGECNCMIPSEASSFQSRDNFFGSWLPIHGDKMKMRIERKFEDMQRLHEEREAEAVICESQPKQEELFNVDAFVPSKTRRSLALVSEMKSNDVSLLSLTQHCDRLFSDIMGDIDDCAKMWRTIARTCS